MSHHVCMMVLYFSIVLSIANAFIFIDHMKMDSLDHIKTLYENKDDLDSDSQFVAFHYFKTHDFNGDNMLDGIEIRAALQHTGDEGLNTHELMHKEISDILHADIDGDGFIDWDEFLLLLDEH